MKLNISLENFIGFDLLFKSFGLWLLNGATPGTREAITNAFVFAKTQKFIDKKHLLSILDSIDSKTSEREYCQLFCIGNSSLSLYESVWKTGLVMQQPREDVFELLNILEIKPQMKSNEPEDHAGLLLYLYGEILSGLFEKQELPQNPNRFEILLSTLVKVYGHLDWFPNLELEIKRRNSYFHENLIGIAYKAATEIRNTIIGC